jgi:mannose-6-phosphate isomerase-like protein (cupin superfamily)
MAEATIYQIEVRSTDDPEFAKVARKISLPERDKDSPLQFWPALAGFNVGSESNIDISYLESTDRAPTGIFDRHLRTEELFVCLDGEYIVPLAPCRNSDDPDELPRPEDLLCFHIKAGDLYVLKANVWHNGGWPAPGSEKMRYIMVLSGHRSGEGHQGRVDYIMKELPDGAQILPKVGGTGQ